MSYIDAIRVGDDSYDLLSSGLSGPAVIDGIPFDGSTAITHYAVCATAEDTAAKVASVTDFVLAPGSRLAVKFTYANTASDITLNVSGTGAQPVKMYGTNSTGAPVWQAGEVVTFIYDGTNWCASGITAAIVYDALGMVASEGAPGNRAADWAVGSFNGAAGNNITSSTRIRTTAYLPSAVERVAINTSGYQFAVYAWNAENAYQGIWNGYNFSTSVTGNWITEVNLGDIGDYQFKLLVRKSDDSAASTDMAAYVTMWTTAAPDKTLTESGNAADAAAAGRRVEAIAGSLFLQEKVASGGYYTLVDKPLNISTGLLTGIYQGCHTNTVAVGTSAYLTLGLSDYLWTSWSYSSGSIGSSSATHNNTDGAYVSGDVPIIAEKNANDTHIAIGFRRKDGAAMTTDTTSSTSDWYKIQHALHIYTAGTDTTLSESGVPADARAVGDAITYALDTSEFSWAFGGVGSDGRSNSSTTRLRMLGADGKGAIAVSTGSVITANSGYKFSVALYSEYQSYSDFVLSGFRAMGPGSYTVPNDCYIRVTIGTTADDALWYKDDSGVNTLTAAGTAAEANALSFNLIGSTVKQAIANLQSGVSGDNAVLEIPTAIPGSSENYHALWYEMAGLDATGTPDASIPTFAERISLNDWATGAGVDVGTFTLPIYLYRICSDKGFLDSHYNFTAWNGSNEIYTRPKIILCAGIHGNERTMPMALWDFASRLQNDVNYQALRNAFDWYVIPLQNPYGFNNDVRTNENGYDINRDFSDTPYTYSGLTYGFVTPEARILKNAFDTITSNGANKAVFLIDGHQAWNTNNRMQATAAFLSLANVDMQTPGDRDLVCGRFMQAGAEAQQILTNWLNMTNSSQTVCPWDGTASKTLRNYGPNYADISMCFEGSITCAYYSNSTTYSNPICRAVINTIFQRFVRRLGENWM